MRQGPESDNVQKVNRPYWKRAHQDWRFWLALMLMLVAMGIYVMSEDLSIRPRSGPTQSVSGGLGK
jgi:hypothetical protein